MLLFRAAVARRSSARLATSACLVRLVWNIVGLVGSTSGKVRP